jgi:hypothetical protein
MMPSLRPPQNLLPSGRRSQRPALETPIIRLASWSSRSVPVTAGVLRVRSALALHCSGLWASRGGRARPRLPPLRDHRAPRRGSREWRCAGTIRSGSRAGPDTRRSRPRRGTSERRSRPGSGRCFRYLSLPHGP